MTNVSTPRLGGVCDMRENSIFNEGPSLSQGPCQLLDCSGSSLRREPQPRIAILEDVMRGDGYGEAATVEDVVEVNNRRKFS